jgi:Arc/MetJ family transcription regulator
MKHLQCEYIFLSVHIELATMRTNIEIDDDLLAQAMAATGLPTKRATVEAGLQMLVQIRQQAEAFESLRGLGWDGDLDAMRQGRDLGQP